MKIEKVAVESLSVDPANVRTHGSRNLDAIKASLRRFGQQKPIVVDASNIVRAGNGTLESAMALGWETIDIVKTGLVASEATAFSIADNRTAELGEWDDELLALQLSALNHEDSTLLNDVAFTSEELASLLSNSQDEVIEDDKETFDPPSDPVTKSGDVWILGDHRLICGDCRNQKHVAKLFKGEKAAIAFTSPPYASQRKYDEETEFKPIHPDAFVKWFDKVQSNVAKHLREDGSLFVNIKEHCEDGQRVLYVKDLTLAHVREWGWRFTEEWCWSHCGTPKAVFNRFKNAWEPIFQFTKNEKWKFRPDAVKKFSDRIPHKVMDESGMIERQGIRGAFELQDGGELPCEKGLAYPSNVISAGLNASCNGHPAAFPVALPEFFIRCHTDEGEVVFDPFIGSGSTMLAANNTSRVCYGSELSPAYCDIIVERWTNATGGKAKLE